MQPSTTPIFTLADASADTRARFMRRTFLHLAGAVLAFAGLEVLLLRSETATSLAIKVLQMPYGWLAVLGIFCVTGWLARGFAARGNSKITQYAGLGIYVIAEALIFLPLMMLAVHIAGIELLAHAAVMTGLLVCGLVSTVLITRKDFSFLGTALTLGGLLALGLLLGGVFLGFELGLWFSVGMIALAAGAILYDTSKILHTYQEDQHVGAALELFASVALLFFYVVRLLISLRD